MSLVTLKVFDQVDSTMDEAKRFIQSQEAIAGDVAIIAYTQTRGRGRRGQAWISSMSGNLHLSLAVPFQENPSVVGEFSFIAAVALREVIAEILSLSDKVLCKWPNDILVDGCKVAGILLENYERPNDKSNWLILGVGVNINAYPEEDVNVQAACLNSFAEVSLTPEAMTEKFYGAFDRWRTRRGKEGFKVIRDEWMKWAAGLGQKVKIRLPHQAQPIEGIFCTLDFDGAFVLETWDRKRVRIHVADIWMF